jgi:type IV pilus assembly protein PilB
MVAALPTPVPGTPMSGLARALLQAGHLSEAQVDALGKQALTSKSAFIDVLLQSGSMDAYAVANFCCETFAYPFLDFSAFNLQMLPEKIIDFKLMQSQRVIPLAKRGNKISIAISDPTNTQALEQIKFKTELLVEPVIVEHTRLMQMLDKLGQTTSKTITDFIGDDIDGNYAEAESDELADSANAEIDDAPIVRFLQKILIDAINLGASDLHFEPFEKFYRIRFRIDGVLREISQPPLAIKEKLASRIKVISKLDISEKRVPQDGRMKLALTKTRSIDFRVSTLPTLFGEKIVMRILDGTQAQMGIEALGYEPEQKALLMEAIGRPYGMVLVTGPTGSGKTVSLYTCLNLLNKPGVNIATAEDPAEINLPGVNQVNVNERAGLTFPVALRSFLRQDPDVIMVGEIRDLETADIAIKAAQTGHLVFSTLHTNDAPATITRLMNMGVAPFNIASSIIMITAQRLARRLCSCKQPAAIPQQVLLDAGFMPEELDGSWTPFQPKGCERCSDSGYKGRVGIYQIMPITEAIEKIILAHGTAPEIEQQARLDGVKTLREAGLVKVRLGLTSLEEILACTNA